MRPNSKPLFLKGKLIMKTRLFVAALVSLSFVVGSALAADKELTGSCPISGKPISKARLIARPWAKYCVEYARRKEKGMVGPATLEAAP